MTNKILFVGLQDFANVATDISSAINHHLDGWESKSICLTQHPFQYQNDHDWDYQKLIPGTTNYALTNKEEQEPIKKWIDENVKLVVIAQESIYNGFASWYNVNDDFKEKMLFGKLGFLKERAKFIIFHAGQPYRQQWRRFNAVDLNYFDAQCMSPDLYRFGLPGAIPLFGKPFTVDLNKAHDLWVNVRNTRKEIWVMHSPTDYTAKGSKFIQAGVEQAAHENKHIEYKQVGGPWRQQSNLSHKELEEARNVGHIYVDQFSSIGGIGMSTFEALGAGMIVLCTHGMIDRSIMNQAGMDECPILTLPMPTGDEKVDTAVVKEKIQELCNLTPSQLHILGMAGACWVKQFYDPAVFAQRYKTQIIERVIPQKKNDTK